MSDSDGRFLEGVLVTFPLTTVAATTDARGQTTIAVPTGQEQVLRLTKTGFAEQFKVMQLPAGTETSAVTAVMLARPTAITLAAAETGGSVAGASGASVTLPPDALTDAQGNAVRGSVDVSLTPLDVRTDLAASPGRLEGIPEAGERTPIVTWGMTEFEFRQGDKELNLAPGTTATILLPIYIATNQDGSPVAAGQQLPLWSLDETTGIWKQEGSGEVVAAPGSPTGFALAATVSHFSWWNVDQARRLGEGREPFRARVVCRLAAENGEPLRELPAGAAAQVTITVGGGGPRSVATTSIPSGGSDELIPSGVPVLLEAQTSHTAAGTFTAAFGSLRSVFPENGAGVVEIVLRAVDVPAPTIVVPADTIATNSGEPVRVLITLDGPVPDAVELSVDGRLLQTFSPQFFYRFAWDTSSEREGEHALVATAIVGGARRPSAARVVNVDRTAPRMVQVTPPPGSGLSEPLLFDVHFSEPVLASPFRLQDVVVLTITPNGGAPQPVAMRAMLLQGNTILHVEPVEPLRSIGTLGLSWGALRDVAGNAISGTIASTWPIDPVRTLPVLAYGGGRHLKVALTTGGVLFALHNPRGAALAVSRFDVNPGVWTELPGPINPPPLLHPGATLALDSAGTPIVAFARFDGSFGTEYFVRRFEGAGWRTLGQSFTSGFTGAPQDLGFAIDAMDRPILAIMRGNGVEVHRYEHETGMFALLDRPVGDPTLVKGFALALKGDGNPVVAVLEELRPGLRIVASELVGARWQTLGGAIDSVTTGNGLGLPAIAVGSSIHVGYAKDAGSRTTLMGVRRWNGAAWVDLEFPGPVPMPFRPDAPGLALRNDHPVLVHGPDDVLLRLFDGTGWSEAIPAHGPSVSPFPEPRVTVGNGRVFVGHAGRGNSGYVVEVLFP